MKLTENLKSDSRNIWIVGESNSVLRNGWVSGFEKIIQKKVTNFSIGSTSIFNAIRVLKNDQLSSKPVQLIIFDSFIQDSTFFKNDPILYKNLLRSVFLSFTTRFNCSLAYIYFSKIEEDDTNLKDILISQCQEHEVFFYDTRKYLLTQCETQKKKLADFYFDSVHPKPEIAMQFGEHFGSCLLKIEQASMLRKMESHVAMDRADCFLYVDWNSLKKNNMLNLQEIKNSLVNFEVIVLDSKSESIIVDVSDSHMIPLAIFFNAIASKGCFNIQGENKLVKNINSPSFNLNGKQVWARRIHSIVKPDLRNRFQVSAVRAIDGNLIELTENCKLPDLRLDEEPICQLISIIFIDIKKLFGDDLTLWALSKMIEDSVISNYTKKISLNSLGPEIDAINALSHERAINIALNCHAFQSSYFTTRLQSAVGGCNGIKSGTYGFCTALENNPWWCLDLGSLKEVGTIVCYNRTDAGMSRVEKLRIYISDNNNDWQQIYDHFGTPPFGGINTLSSIAPLVLTFKNKLKGRYLRFELFDKNYFHLDEVEVYG
jgi:hypothetical protein